MDKKEKEELLKEIEEYSKKIKEEPNNDVYYNNRGVAFDNLEEFDKAIEDYNKAIELEPNDASYYNSRGNVYYFLKNYETAIENYSQAISLNSEKGLYFYNHGISYYNLKEYEKTIEDYDKAIELEPNNASYWNSRGNTYYNLKEYEKAIEDYNKAIELKPNNASYWNNRGDTYYNLKEYEKAIEDYNKVIELEPNDASYYNSRGNAYLMLEKYDKASNDYNEAIRLNNSPTTYNNQGKIYYILKKYDEALKNCDKAIELNPDNALFYTNRGKTYSKLKRYEEAINEYKKAIKLNPNYEEANELKEITSNYLCGNFRKTKGLLLSFRKKYIKSSEENQIEVYLEELTAIKNFLEITQKELEGYLTFADILGWKGIWKKQNTDDEKIDTLNTLLFIKHKLEEEFKEEEENYKINLISDTYVIFSKNFQINGRLSKRLIELCLKNDLLIRGATSYGKFYNNDMVYIGQAVDEAASWHEKGEEIGIFYTSSAKLSIKEGNSIEYELKNSYLKKGTIKTKLGEIKTYYINWYNKETKKDFYRIMKDEVISPDISSKYLNTEESIEKHLNVKNNKILRSNKYVKNR